MLEEFRTLISQNKNMLMLITASVYVLALYSALSENIIPVSLFLCILFIFLGCKNFLPLKYLVIWTIIFSLGVANISLRLKDTDDLLNLAPVNSEITGTVISIPQGLTENKPKFFFNVEKINFGSVEKTFKSEKVLVTVNIFPDSQFNLADLKLYNSLKLTGRLSRPFIAGNPSQFDYGNYLRNHNTYAVFYAKDFEKLNKDFSLKEKFMQRVNDYRENVLSIHSKYLPSPNLEILGGIVFGDDAVSPPKNIKQSFINSGLLHILAASGMNVAFIYAFFYFIMSVLRINYKVRVVTGMIMVVVYALMTGLGASVIRATFMLLFVLVGKLIDRDAHSISLLSFVALLMLLYNPFWVNDVGFQLSFVVTFGILLMAPAFDRSNNKILNFVISSVTIPIIAQLWVIPIQIYYFNNISLYSVFANIMSVPIVMALSFGGFISSLLSMIHPIANFICSIFDFVLNPMITLLVSISDFWGSLPHSALKTSHPSMFQMLVYYGCLMCLAALLYKELRNKYLKKVLCAFFVLLTVILVLVIPLRNSNLEITSFDVGNADCFLIKTPENKYIMIDTGKIGFNGGKSQAEVIIIKYLMDKGIKNLDSLIITHFDNDHCGGASDIMRNVKVGKIYFNDINHDSTVAKDIYKTAKENNVEQIAVKNKQIVYENNGLKIMNLNNYEGKSDNDNSIITLLTIKDFSMLFTGDAGINGIKGVLSEIPKNITVLKAPHHGAIGGINKSIVSYLNPKYSVISTGENQFGHPSLYVLSLLENSKILRTDIYNSVRFVIKNDKMKVYYYDIKSRKYKRI